MKKGGDCKRIVFTGGGTGGHIYPGIAVADEFKSLCDSNGVKTEIYWIGSSTGMDRSIIEKNDSGSITAFYGIPCGKLRRYFSLQNFIDIFKIAAGFVKSIYLLRKIRPDFVFSKGGFVSVPPCKAAKLLHIPYFTHECDFTPGLATRLNSNGAKNILLSYEETKKFFADSLKSKCITTGNPVRPSFYTADGNKGLDYLGINKNHDKPILLVLGGSLGAKQVNELVVSNLDWLKERFVVVHQTGKAFAEENPSIMTSGDDNYKPFAFIYSEMPSVIKCADVILSRSGANSLWECAVCGKPMLLIPLCGSGTRGDQVDNAEYFESRNAAFSLVGDKATGENLRETLTKLLDEDTRLTLSKSLSEICKDSRPAFNIASLIADGSK